MVLGNLEMETHLLKHPTHTYMDTCQSFDINLIVTDNNTCSDTVDINYYVNCNPTG